MEPKLGKKDFKCPRCGIHSRQNWGIATFDALESLGPGHILETETSACAASFCDACKLPSFWLFELDKVSFDKEMADAREKLAADAQVASPNIIASNLSRVEQELREKHQSLLRIHPRPIISEKPHAEMPDGIKDDFEEARRIAHDSPRGAAALLRLCIQKLCVALGKPGKNINADIASLVQDGLDPMIQQAMDAVRVIGNESVHPGTLDLKDDIDTVEVLFRLVNDVVENRIAHPKRVQEFYSSRLPQSKIDGINNRDGNSS